MARRGCPHGRREGGATVEEPALKQRNQLINLVPRLEVLREKVRRVGLPGDLQKLELAPPQSLLHPQGVALQVAQLPETLPPPDSDGSGRVRPDSDREVDPEISVQGLDAQGDADAPDDPIVLGFARAKRDRRLGG